MVRPRNKYFHVYCDKDSKAAIESNAKSAGMSVSSYLRNHGLSAQIKPLLEEEAFEPVYKLGKELAKTKSKLEAWLNGQDEPKVDVAKLMDGAKQLNVKLEKEIAILGEKLKQHADKYQS